MKLPDLTSYQIRQLIWQRYGKLIQCTKKRWMHRVLCRCVRETLTENLCKIDHKLIHRSHTGRLHPLYPKPFWFQRQNNTKKQESKAKGKRNHTNKFWLALSTLLQFLDCGDIMFLTKYLRL